MSIILRRDGHLVTLGGAAPSLPDDGDRYIEALRGISAQDSPYVLLVDLAVEIELTQEQRKAQNLWYKADRAAIEANCLACAMVRPGADADMQRVWQGLFDFPVLVTRERAEAEAFLARVSPKENANG